MTDEARSRQVCAALRFEAPRLPWSSPGQSSQGATRTSPSLHVHPPPQRPEGYDDLLRDLKKRERTARARAALAVNCELVLLHWSIGREIPPRQEQLGWGAQVIDRLAHDLRAEFPGLRGFSARNLKYMRSFAQAWPDAAIVQGVLAQLAWWQNLALLEKLSDPDQRL